MNLMPQLVGMIGELVAGGHPGVVDENLDAAELVERARRHRAHLLGVGHVADQRQAAAAQRAYLLRQRLKLPGGAPDRHDVGP